jgi:hypothetical protein
MHNANRPVPKLKPINTSTTCKLCAMIPQRSERVKHEPSHYIPTLPASTSSYVKNASAPQVSKVLPCSPAVALVTNDSRPLIKAWAVLLLLNQGW